MSNFYSLRFNEKEFIPLIREGVRIDVNDNIAYLNGVFSYRIVTSPQIRESNDIDTDKLFAIYPDKMPWIAQENDGNWYLYKGSINPDSLNLQFNIDENICYIKIELSLSGSVSIDSGRVISRVFEDKKQICILEVNKYANIIIEQKSLITILDWDGNKFVCR